MGKCIFKYIQISSLKKHIQIFFLTVPTKSHILIVFFFVERVFDIRFESFDCQDPSDRHQTQQLIKLTFNVMKAQREGQAGDGGMVGKCNDFQFFGGGVL